MKNPIKYAVCKFCGTSLHNLDKPCPKCGKKSRFITLEFNEVITPSDQLNYTHTREFYQENPKLKWLVIGINFISPFLGLFLLGWWGVGFGLIVAFATTFLVPPITLKVREITKFTS